VGKHEKTLAAIFAEPVRANVKWRDVEALLKSKGAHITEHRGSRICVELGGAKSIFHRPHPQPEAKKSIVKSVRRFLIEAGVTS